MGKFYDEFIFILNKILDEKNYNINHEVLEEIKKYQLLRMPSVNQKPTQAKFKYNIAEYMYGCSKKEFVPLRQSKILLRQLIQQILKIKFKILLNIKLFGQEKSDKIKNEIDYDLKMQIKQKEKEINIDNMEEEKKPKLFEKVSKFEKYSAINLKNQRRIN